MPDMLVLVFLINVLILTYLILFAKYRPKKYKTIYSCVLMVVVLVAFGSYIWYSIGELIA
ncbi:hypothetical protein [Listeria grandensis]|uniref:hypothetical protein n=1 Tax=Listeria grandensis TaxID=1494963 RepID=UPI0004B0A88A|nr:hypothetical protein [Listeria grandensis]MBC6315656.1 hypothetical protein [Listeria grandensis]